MSNYCQERQQNYKELFQHNKIKDSKATLSSIFTEQGTWNFKTGLDASASKADAWWINGSWYGY